LSGIEEAAPARSCLPSIAAAEWNTLKKNISLKSRGRTPTTGYDDVDYIIHS
jgi:hypothetical protein